MYRVLMVVLEPLESLEEPEPRESQVPLEDLGVLEKPYVCHGYTHNI